MKKYPYLVSDKTQIRLLIAWIYVKTRQTKLNHLIGELETR
jgi:hypothetical protein